jgi:hypothetical protein
MRDAGCEADRVLVVPDDDARGAGRFYRPLWVGDVCSRWRRGGLIKHNMEILGGPLFAVSGAGESHGPGYTHHRFRLSAGSG